MSEAIPKTPSQIILGWWSHNVGARDSAAARGLSARLRRAGPVGVLGEAAVHDLARALQMTDAAALIRLVQVLAEVRDHTSQPLAAVLGQGDAPALSTLRFQRLMRGADSDLTDSLRRAVVMADRRCNVAALGADLLFWSEKTRSRWCFQYFGAQTPDALKDALSGGADVMDQEIPQ
jgi:CRISPR system Cascade subunit CasB